MADLWENVELHPKLYVAVDARAACDVIVAIDVCEPHGSNFEFHIISLMGRLIQSIIGRMHWANAGKFSPMV